MDTVGELRKALANFSDDDPIYIAISYCEQLNDDPQLDVAKVHRHSVTSVEKTSGPMYEGKVDILASNHGDGVEIAIHQNESLRVHLSNDRKSQHSWRERNAKKA